MKKIIAITLMLIGTLYCYGQKQGQAKIDSLQDVLKTATEDTNKVNTLNALAWEFSNSNPDTSILIGTQALQLAKKIKWALGIGKSHDRLGVFLKEKGDFSLSLEHYNKALAIFDGLEKLGIITKPQNQMRKSKTIGNIANLYYEQGDYPKALDYYLKALKMGEELGDKNGIATQFGNIGSVYRDQGDYTKGLDYYFKALRLHEELGNKNGIETWLGNIAIVYDDQGDYFKALEYYFKALKLTEDLGDKIGTARHLGNIGVLYQERGDSAIAKGNKSFAYAEMYPKALEYYFKALKMADQLGDKNEIGRHFCNIGIIYDKQGDYPQALDYYFKALKMDEEIGTKGQIATAMASIGSIYIKQNKLQEADKFLHDALQLDTEIGTLDGIKNDNQNLSELYSKQGNWKKAYDYYKQSIAVRDSMNNEETAKKETRLEMNYEFEKKQAVEKVEQDKKDALSDAELKRQKLSRNAYAGAGIALFLLSGGLYNRYRHKKRSNTLLEEKNAIITKEKERSDELLLNILPYETAQELKEKGSSDAKMFDDVTIMFTDFKDFTKITEKLSPSELVAEIDYCFKGFDNIMGKHNIEKIKTIGDSYMAAGGLPVPNKTNAKDVVRAAMEIQQFMAEHKQQRIKEGKPVFEIRIGVHTGPVVAGIVGIKKFAYDIWGDAVNIASRMQSSGVEGKVNISGSTYEGVKDEFKCFHRGKIEAKNKGEIDMYFVEGLV